jgi:hypothetical protein|tara:strand:+ start:510 stop:623 length:114 start_codon:yes stop_codon:yes gene_type:complete
MAILPEPVQFDRVMANLRRKLSDIERCISSSRATETQ